MNGNSNVNKWLQEQGCSVFPADDRALRDRIASTGSNVVQYRRDGDGRVTFLASEGDGDILYIDQSTPLPPDLPERPQSGEDEDVLYID